MEKLAGTKFTTSKPRLLGRCQCISWTAAIWQYILKFLRSQGYQVERFHLSRHSTEGIVFSQPARLEKLRRHGYLTLGDSIHKPNRYDWRLFTLYIRDGFGCWEAGGYFFVSSEDGETVGTALKIVQRFERRWSPMYMLVDQSSAEANRARCWRAELPRYSNPR